MGDFAAPAAAANGSSICINNNLNSSLSGAGGAGIGVNSTPHGPPAAAPGNNNANSGGIPKHSTVVERLRQRIEGCRRHHVNCESRYQQAQAEQLELERRDTVSLYQRTLEQRAKKTGTGGGGSKQQHQSKQQQDAEPATAEQRNHTLIMSIIGSVFGNTAVVTLKGEVTIRSVKDDEEDRFSPQCSPKKTSSGHSVDSYQ
ncbi:mastermind-like protein 3, partial [Malurus melanocephalus]|uniref:mastermind-like protein 3 n=1 Tax=Malurus melanocephalus TaxID=175006 RepID=UPI002546ACC1